MIVGMGGFLIGNMLNNNITNSGAFEIYCNERLIWSAINNEKNKRFNAHVCICLPVF